MVSSSNNSQLIPRFSMARPLYMSNFVGIIGGPSSGKTTLLRTIKKSGECVGGRVVCADLTHHIRKWHLEPSNNSPLRNMCLSHQKFIDSGIFIPDDEVNQIVMYFLYAIERRILHERSIIKFSSTEDEVPGIGTFICSGWPRNVQQLEFVKKHFSNPQLMMIDIDQEEANKLREIQIARGENRPDDNDSKIFNDRWNTFNSVTLPMFLDFEKQNPRKVARIGFNKSLAVMATTLIREAIPCCKIRSSLLSKIEPRNKNTATSATQFIAQIESCQLVTA